MEYSLVPEAVGAPLTTQVASVLPVEERVTAHIPRFTIYLLRPFLVPILLTELCGNQMLRNKFYSSIIPMKEKESKEEAISLPRKTETVSASLVGSSGAKIYVSRKLIGSSPLLRFNQSLAGSQRESLTLD